MISPSTNPMQWTILHLVRRFSNFSLKIQANSYISPWCSYDFPTFHTYFPISCQISHDFPISSHDFPIVFPWKSKVLQPLMPRLSVLAVQAAGHFRGLHVQSTEKWPQRGQVLCPTCRAQARRKWMRTCKCIYTPNTCIGMYIDTYAGYTYPYAYAYAWVYHVRIYR